MGNIAVYIRTSTRDQDGQAQKLALEKSLAQRGELLGCVFYTDIGHSGSKAKRPALEQLRIAARKGDVAKVYVYGLDRLGRSLQNLLELFGYFASCGVAIVSLREGIDLSTPAGRLQVHMLAALAEFERELIRERTLAGLANARAKGIKLGRKTGSKRTECAAQAIALRQAGRTIAEIAGIVGLPNTTVFRIVKQTLA